MIMLRKRRPSSMFKRFFVVLTVTVVVCLTTASFFLVTLFANFWKTEGLTSLSNDALSFAQSVELFYGDLQEENENSETLTGLLLMIANSLYSTEKNQGADVFLIDTDGKILMCKDRIFLENENVVISPSCEAHKDVVFPDEILSQAVEKIPEVYTFEGEISILSEGEYLLACAPVMQNSTAEAFVVTLQSLSDVYLPYTTGFLRMFILSQLMSLLIVFITALIASFTMVKPLKKVTEATTHYSKGDFSIRINTYDSYKELAELIESINSMVDNLALYEESRSNFVANVSHELKTPMTIISGFVDGILDGTVPEKEAAKYLQIVSDEVKRLSRLVIAMLNMSKIEAGQLTLNPSPIQLSDMVIRNFIGFEKIIEEHSINIKGIDNLENIVVNADDVLINQIIYNLIDNAVKFTPFGGTITVSLSEDGKKNAELKIRNSGSGIAPEECNLIFDRFYKVDKSRGLDSKSFGMGLHIAKRIVELHQGTIRINSEIDEYTEFVIRLPIQ
ncbi:MAG: HAMP domain-containing histidine kinase [Clostridia bacterium]|nr:HAMP domain-containing histidine kinase [Clostridia bacterium]